jgi:hypothetical protein
MLQSGFWVLSSLFAPALLTMLHSFVLCQRCWWFCFNTIDNAAEFVLALSTRLPSSLRHCQQYFAFCCGDVKNAEEIALALSTEQQSLWWHCRYATEFDIVNNAAEFVLSLPATSQSLFHFHQQ